MATYNNQPAPSLILNKIICYVILIQYFDCSITEENVILTGKPPGVKLIQWRRLILDGVRDIKNRSI